MKSPSNSDAAGNALGTTRSTLISKGGLACAQDDGQINPKEANSSHRLLWLIVVIGCLAAFVDVVIASRSGLWGDEILSLAKATGHSLDQPANVANPKQGDFVEAGHSISVDEFRRYLRHDNPPAGLSRVIRAVLLSEAHPPLYFVLLYVWTIALGTSDIALRSFSVLCSLACLPFVTAIARRVGGNKAVVPSCALFAFSPLTIYFATEGRMYSLLLLSVFAVMWASLRLHDDGWSLKIGAFWVLSSAAGFLTQHLFVFPWLAVLIWLLIGRGKLIRWRLALCVFLAMALILPWYLRLPNSVGNFRVTPTGTWLTQRPHWFDRTAALRDLIVQSFSGTSQQLWPFGSRDIVYHQSALILFGVVAAIAVWRLRLQAFRGGRLLLWLVFGAACVGPLVFDLVAHSYTIAVPRYSVAALAGAYLLVGLAFSTLERRVALIGLMLIILSWLPDVYSMYRAPSPWRPLREIAHAASVNSSPSDLILVHDIPEHVFGIARYAIGSAALACSFKPRSGSPRALIAGRTRVIFVWNALESVPEAKWFRANAVACGETRVGPWVIAGFRPMDSETF